MPPMRSSTVARSPAGMAVRGASVLRVLIARVFNSSSTSPTQDRTRTTGALWRLLPACHWPCPAPLPAPCSKQVEQRPEHQSHVPAVDHRLDEADQEAAE